MSGRSKLTELRVFLSSTFRDLQDERAYLGKKIFPEIRAVCRERGVEFTEIDLRWGLTTEDAEQGRIIRTCLDEIDRSRPFFLGILGDRYGWCPGHDEVRKDPDLLRDFPWMEKALADDVSVTEMEFLHGVLNEPEKTDAAYFYFRDPVNAPDETEARRLEELKDSVRGTGKPTRQYHSPAELGAQVREDLLAIIEAYWPAESTPDWLEQERAGHEAFAASRRRAYIPKSEYLEILDEQIELELRPLIISGASGAGKSALIAYWASTLRQRDPDAFVIEHYLGTTNSGSDHRTMLRRIMLEIRERFDISDHVPTDGDEIERDFPIWLAKIQKERCVLIIDAVNQLSGAAARFGWLPEFMPEKVKLVVAAAHEETLDALRGRRWPELRVLPLTSNEREDMIVSFLAGYRKALSISQRRALANDEKASSPLFLRTVLEELRLFGYFERLDECIAHYLESKDIPDLFQRVLHRMEEDHGTEAVSQVMRLIWSAPSGLSEHELAETSGISRAQLSQLLVALEYHLVRRQGLLDFFHDYLRQAVEFRYLAENEERLRVKAELATYFESSESSERRSHALPKLLEEIEAWERLRTAIASIQMLPYLGTNERRYELNRYWMLVRNYLGITEEDIYRSYEDSFESSTEDAPKMAGLLVLASSFFRDAGQYNYAEPFLRRCLLLESSLGATAGPLVRSKLGNILLHLAKLDEAETLLRLAFDQSKEDPALHSLHLKIGNDLVWLLHQKGDLQNAERLAREIVNDYKLFRGLNHAETAHALGHLANILREQGKLDAAIELFTEAIRIHEVVHGPDHPDTAGALNDCGLAKQQKGEYVEAENVYRRALLILNVSLGNNHPHVGVALMNLANLLRVVGKYDKAEPLYQRALHIQELRLGLHHPQLADLLHNLGMFYREKGDLEPARKSFEQALAIKMELFGMRHLAVAQTQNELGFLLIAEGELPAAEVVFRQSLETRIELLGEESPITARAMHNLAIVLRDEGKVDEAYGLFVRALELREATIGPLHPDTAKTFHELGRLHALRDEDHKAQHLFEKALEVRRAKLGEDHPDTARVMQDLGVFFVDRGHVHRGRRLIELAHAVHHRVLGPEHPETRQAHDHLERARLKLPS